MKRFICMVFAAMMLLCLLPLSVEAHAESSGALSDTLSWTLEDNCLTIFGKGEIPSTLQGP